jgi:hypothetical protein
MEVNILRRVEGDSGISALIFAVFEEARLKLRVV